MLKVGERVTARGIIDYSTAYIQQGELGTVVETGGAEPLLEYGVSVQWDAYHHGLSWWDNETLLVGDDILTLSRVRERLSLGDILLHPALGACLILLVIACEVANAVGVF